MTTLILRAISLLAPADLREPWLTRWRNRLDSIRIIAGRGEMPRSAPAEIRRLLRTAAAEVVRLGAERFRLERTLRGPAFFLCGAGAVIAAAACLTRGFHFTRTLVRMAGDAAAWESGDLLVAHALPLATGLLAGLFLLTRQAELVPGARPRYWLFLAVKTAVIAVSLPVLWIEIGGALRAPHPEVLRRLTLLCLLSAVVFVVVFARSLAWSFADQRRRCPACLDRLAMPVRVGSWSSVFEPPRQELLCSRGHGALCLGEAVGGSKAQWVALDDSWRDLFA